MGEAATQNAAQHRRSAPRIDIEVEVGFNDHNNFYVGFSENISEGGLFVATYDLKPVGTEMTIRFALPSGDEIETIGVVRWIRDPRDNQDSDTPPGLGVQFEQLTEEQQRLIREFTELQAPIFYPD